MLNKCNVVVVKDSHYGSAVCVDVLVGKVRAGVTHVEINQCNVLVVKDAL